MELWQMDVTASLFLADGRECKIITGIDDHSRFCVIATVVLRATARAVCLAFVTAMQEYGIPAEVLSDNGKQFTGRFGRPRPAEVLFERICRENGITQRLTKPRSPTTTGKIERLHQTLQQELLNVHGPFASIEDAQAAVDTWRKQYNTDRPHQSLAMGFPAARFTRASSDVLGLRVPAELARTAESAEPVSIPDADASPLLSGPTVDRVGWRAGGGAGPGGAAVGEPVAGRPADLARARADRPHRPAVGRTGPGARAAGRLPGQDPAVPARRPRPGPPRRGRCPPRRAAAAAPGMRGARAGTAQPPRLPEPLVVTRRVSARGAIMIGGQKIQVGLAHARKTAEVSVEADTYQVTVEPGITITAPRATSRDIRRHKASNYA
jgi:Integrase core domain